MRGFLSSADISATGLAAERTRMQVIANNVANANATRTDAGGPYRRQVAVFAPLLEERFGSGPSRSGGVQVLGIQNAEGEHPRIYDPAHPDADADGYLEMPNVSIAKEMVEMISASRSYEANLHALKNLRSMIEHSLSLLRPQ